jgi:hypothetical protein
MKAARAFFHARRVVVGTNLTWRTQPRHRIVGPRFPWVLNLLLVALVWLWLCPTHDVLSGLFGLERPSVREVVERVPAVLEFLTDLAVERPGDELRPDSVRWRKASRPQVAPGWPRQDAEPCSPCTRQFPPQVLARPGVY